MKIKNYKRKILTQNSTINELCDGEIEHYRYFFDIIIVKKNNQGKWSRFFITPETINNFIPSASKIVYSQLKYYFNLNQVVDGVEYIPNFRFENFNEWGDMFGNYTMSYKYKNVGRCVRIEFTSARQLTDIQHRKILKSIKPKLNKLVKSYNRKLFNEKWNRKVLYKINIPEKDQILYV